MMNTDPQMLSRINSFFSPSDNSSPPTTPKDVGDAGDANAGGYVDTAPTTGTKSPATNSTETPTTNDLETDSNGGKALDEGSDQFRLPGVADSNTTSHDDDQQGDQSYLVLYADISVYSCHIWCVYL